MLTQYQEYMNRRAELIKKGWSLPDATNQAYLDAYSPKKEMTAEEILSPANQ